MERYEPRESSIRNEQTRWTIICLCKKAKPFLYESAMKRNVWNQVLYFEHTVYHLQDVPNWRIPWQVYILPPSSKCSQHMAENSGLQPTSAWPQTNCLHIRENQEQGWCNWNFPWKASSVLHSGIAGSGIPQNLPSLALLQHDEIESLEQTSLIPLGSRYIDFQECRSSLNDSPMFVQQDLDALDQGGYHLSMHTDVEHCHEKWILVKRVVCPHILHRRKGHISYYMSYPLS